jgi:hypothetical protein
MACADPPVEPLRSRRAELAGLFILSTEHHALREIVIDRPRMRIGRRPYNDILLDDLTVSGDHALLYATGSQAIIHDLNSRNGTLINGLPVSKKVLADGDLIEIGVYRLRYACSQGGRERVRPDPTRVRRLGLARAWVEVVAGPGIGTVVVLDRPVVAINNQMGQIATIAWRGERYGLTHLEGPTVPVVNGIPVGLALHALAHHDLIELGSTIFRFVLEDLA